MTGEGGGKEASVDQLPGIASGSIATLETALTALVDRMEAEVGDRGEITAISASELRQIRMKAERLLQRVENPPRLV
jgi:hypothetical protein